VHRSLQINLEVSLKVLIFGSFFGR